MRIWLAFKRRLDLFRSVLLGGWRKKIFWSIVVIVGVYDSIASQFFPDYRLPTISKLITGWDWQIWLIIALFLIWLLTFESLYRLYKGKSENWIDNYIYRHGKPPPVPDYLLVAVEGDYTPGEPISKELKLKIASGQLWFKLLPTEKEKLLDLAEWLGVDRRDYEAEVMKMLPPGK